MLTEQLISTLHLQRKSGYCSAGQAATSNETKVVKHILLFKIFFVILILIKLINANGEKQHRLKCDGLTKNIQKMYVVRYSLLKYYISQCIKIIYNGQ